MGGKGEGGKQRLGVLQLIRHGLLPNTLDLTIFEGEIKEDVFAFGLHSNCVNSRPRPELWNLPGSCSLLCGFPTCLRASRLPVVWPQLEKRGSDVGHWLLQDPKKTLPPSPAPVPEHSRFPVGSPGGLLEALWEAPGWLRAGSNQAGASYGSAFPNWDLL